MNTVSLLALILGGILAGIGGGCYYLAWGLLRDATKTREESERVLREATGNLNDASALLLRRRA